jgi:small multidrug resistance pump
LTEVIGTVYLKHSAGFTRLWPSVVVAVSYVAAIVLFGLALKTMPVNLAYAVWSGTCTGALAIFGVLVLKEAVTWPKVLGLVLVTAGVVLLNLGS